MTQPKKMTTEDKPVISLDAFKKLLVSMKVEQPAAQIRVSVSHRPWTDNFLSIGLLCEIGFDGGHTYAVLFNDPKERKTMLLKDIADITAFELDSRFKSYQPNCQYQVSKEA
jgi:hypothetical protein